MPAIDMTTADGRTTTLRRMLTIREFDRRAGEIFAEGDLPGFVHLYIGEEACAVGACGALEPDDYITSTHRGHGHCIAKGLDPGKMMAEIHGKAEGYCNGKGGSMHIADVDAGMLGANGIVGAGGPLATGAALTTALQEDDTVALAFFGDGAVAQGQVHEAINLASTWELPAVFFIENNQYGEGTPVEVQHNIDKLSDTAHAYGIPGLTIDGMDVEAVYETVRNARRRATEGQGPTLIEAETYRYHGHSEGDPQDYRTPDEVEMWRTERDPIETYSKTLLENGDVTESKIEDIRAAVKSDIDEAIEFAREGSKPDSAESYDDMFAEPAPEIDRFRTAMKADSPFGGDWA